MLSMAGSTSPASAAPLYPWIDTYRSSESIAYRIPVTAGYEPFATQDSAPDEDVSAYMAEEFNGKKNATVLEFGTFMADLKAKNPRITGRSVNAIMEAVKGRAANFDVPQEWFDAAGVFKDKPSKDLATGCGLPAFFFIAGSPSI